MAAFKQLNDQEQAVQYYRRERTRAFRGYVLKIPRNIRIVGASSIDTTIPVGSLRSRDALCTFKARIFTPTALGDGLIFSFGDGSNAVAMWVQGNIPYFGAGVATVGDDASVVQGPAELGVAAGAEYNIVGMVRPDGLVGIWIPDFNSFTWASGASRGTFPANTWSADAQGVFGQANAALPAWVGSTAAPTNFEIVEPLSVYYGSLPRVGIPE